MFLFIFLFVLLLLFFVCCCCQSWVSKYGLVVVYLFSLYLIFICKILMNRLVRTSHFQCFVHSFLFWIQNESSKWNEILRECWKYSLSLSFCQNRWENFFEHKNVHNTSNNIIKIIFAFNSHLFIVPKTLRLHSFAVLIVIQFGCVFFYCPVISYLKHLNNCT